MTNPLGKLFSVLRGWKLPLLGAAGLALALITVFGREQAQAKTPAINPPTSPYQTTVAGIGVVEPRSEMLALGTELPGIVRTIDVKVGAKVKPGDLLFSLDQRDIDAQIKTLQANLAATRVQAQDAAAQFESISTVRDSHAIAKDDFNKRRYASEYAKARIDEISAQLEQARVTKERMNIRAPIAGQILEVNVRPGEFAANANLGQPLMRMGDTAVRHVRVEVDEENAALVRADSVAKGFLRGDTQQALPLQFVRFEPYAKLKQNLAVAGQRVDTRVIQVIYALPEKTPPLFIGQQLDVFIDRANANPTTNSNAETNNAATAKGNG
ncbi:MAG: putative Membrane-fusion protein [Verrucomicrobiaceae bacterium]|nr:putative Membrane-fusion protein [Verrucomicrobiaceae bacterium]